MENESKIALPPNQLGDLHNYGFNEREIGELCGRSQTVISYWLRKYGLKEYVREAKPRKAFDRLAHPNMPTADELLELYVTRRIPQDELAVKFDVSQQSIANWLKKYGIETRKCSAARTTVLNEDRLRSLFDVEQKSIGEIAAYFRCAEKTVRHNLIKLGLFIDEREKVRRQKSSERLRASIPVPSREELRAMYLDAELSQDAIGDKYGVSQTLVGQWLQGYYIKRPPPTMVTMGYNLVRLPDHHRANKSGHVLEHIIVAEKAIGHLLDHDEEVHHIDLQKRNNSVGNLAVFQTGRDHSRFHSYAGRVGTFLSGLSPVRPKPLVFSMPVFWGGKYINSIDLVARATGAQPHDHGAVPDLKETIFIN